MDCNESKVCTFLSNHHQALWATTMIFGLLKIVVGPYDASEFVRMAIALLFILAAAGAILGTLLFMRSRSQ